MTASATKVAQGSILTLTATVTGSSPTGVVTFSSNSSYCPSGTNSLVGGTASFQLTASPGTCAFTANYGGDSNNLGSSSGTLNIVFTGSTNLTIYGTTGPDTHEIEVPVTIQ